MLKRLKKVTLLAGKAFAISHLLSQSKWRRNRLLILGYHGVSLKDEHLWDPSLYMPLELFSERMHLLKQSGCNVLPLEEALQRLYTDDLPEMSVALTFDDGSYDFYKQAFPIIKYYGF